MGGLQERGEGWLAPSEAWTPAPPLPAAGFQILLERGPVAVMPGFGVLTVAASLMSDRDRLQKQL